jgi:hypothetical protein
MSNDSSHEIVVRGITWIDFAATAFSAILINAFWAPSLAEEALLLGCATAILLLILLWRRRRPLLIARLKDRVIQIREISHIPPRIVSLPIEEVVKIELLGSVRDRQVHFHLRSGDRREVKLGIGTTRINKRVTDWLCSEAGLPVEFAASFKA